MRIAELGKFYPPHFGGIETLLRSLCEGFARMGAGVDCVVANDAPRTSIEEVNKVKVHRFASYGTMLSTSICPCYVTSLRRLDADVWHAHFPNPLADVAVLSTKRRTPLLISYHSDVIRQASLMRLYGPIVRAMLARAGRIIVSTPAHVEFSPWLGPVREKCVVVPWGIDLDRFAATEPTLRRAAEWRLEAAGRPMILTIGRLVGYKGHRYLIQAARTVDAAVWIVGTGPLEAGLRALARDAGVADRVRFLGSVPDSELPALLHACDVFALPSITPNETFGVVQVEAMACGKPVVSCNLRSGVPFVNQHEITGIIVAPADTSSLADALNRLLRSPETRAALGEAGRRRAEKEFAEAVMLERYWNHISQLAAAA